MTRLFLGMGLGAVAVPLILMSSDLSAWGAAGVVLSVAAVSAGFAWWRAPCRWRVIFTFPPRADQPSPTEWIKTQNWRKGAG